MLDIILPDKDGWTVLRELKANPRLSTVPVIMSSIIDDRNFAASLGAHGFIGKPISRRELLNMVVPLIRDAMPLEDSWTLRTVPAKPISEATQILATEIQQKAV